MLGRAVSVGGRRSHLARRVPRRPLGVAHAHAVRSLSVMKLRLPAFRNARTVSVPGLKFGIRWRAFSDYPEHIKLDMPALSPTMEKGNIASWLKKEGDHVAAGDVIAEVETDKATVAFESVEEGYLAKILVAEGTQDVPLGQLVAILAENEADVAAFKDFSPDGAAPASTPPAAAETPAPAAPAAPAQTTAAPAPPSAPPAQASGRVFATPKARGMAADRGINLQEVAGTGPRDRILAADIAEFQGTTSVASIAPPAPMATAVGPHTDIPHSNVRRTIAKRLTQSKQTVPHYYLTVECNVNKLMEVRARLNEGLDKGERISVNDFILKACALSLRDVPTVNSSWMDDAVRQYNYVDVCVAVSTETGLITPLIKDADLKGLKSIAREVKHLAFKAREGKLQPEEYTGGTFTISNLGMFGVKSFSAIINPPQAAILAIGGADARLVPDSASEQGFSTAKFVSVTMSCDHRVVDGAVGAQWLQAFRGYMEDPMTMLL